MRLLAERKNFRNQSTISLPEGLIMQEPIFDCTNVILQICQNYTHGLNIIDNMQRCQYESEKTHIVDQSDQGILLRLCFLKFEQSFFYQIDLEGFSMSPDIP